MQREYVIIENGEAHLISERTLRVVDENLLATNIMKQNTVITTPLLPSGAIHMRQHKNCSYFLLWRAAKIFSFPLKHTRDLSQEDGYIMRAEETNNHLTIAMPHQLFGFVAQGHSIVDMYVWFMVDAPLTPETPVYTAPLPNQDTRGKTCAGEMLALSARMPINQAMDRAIVYFGASVWNNDLIPAYVPGFIQNVSTNVPTTVMRHWDMATRAMGDNWQKVVLNADHWVRYSNLDRLMTAFTPG